MPPEMNPEQQMMQQPPMDPSMMQGDPSQMPQQPVGQMPQDPMMGQNPNAMMAPPPQEAMPMEPPVDIDAMRKEHHQNLLDILDPEEVEEIRTKVWKEVKKARSQNQDVKYIYSDFIRLLGANIPNKMEASHTNGGGGESSVSNSGSQDMYSGTLLEVILNVAQNALTIMMIKNGKFRARAGRHLQKIPGIDEVIERVSNFCTAYFKDGLLPGYRADLMKSIMWAIASGDAVRKVFPDANRGNPRAALILPGDYYFTGDDKSFEELRGFVHQYFVTEQDMDEKVLKGEWSETIHTRAKEEDEGEELREALLKMGGRTLADDEYEVEGQKYLVMDYYNEINFASDPLADPDQWGALPYRIQMGEEGQLVSIRRNWELMDSLRFTCKEFIHYTCLPSFDENPLGLAQVGGHKARGATVLLRGLMDSAQLANVSTGFMKPTGRQTQRTFDLRSGQYFALGGGDEDIRKNIYTIPYNPPNPVIMQLMQTLEESISRFSSIVTSDLMNVASQASNASLLDILQRMEQLPNGLIQGLYDSFCGELQVFKRGCYEWLPAGKMHTFEWNGEILQISKEDFSPGIEILPASDFSMESQAFKLMRAQIVVQQAQTMPQLHNMPHVLNTFYTDLGYTPEEAQAFVLPPPPPPQGPPPPPPIDPGLVGMKEVEVQREKAHLDSELGMKRLEVEREKNDSKNQIDLLNLQLQNEKLQGEKAKIQAELEKAHLEMAIKVKEMELREKDAQLKYLQQEHATAHQYHESNRDAHAKHLDTQLQALHSIQDLHSKEHTFHNPPVEDDEGKKDDADPSKGKG